MHTVENGNYVPLVFALLPNKNQESYANVFGYMKTKCQEIGLRFDPKKAVCDFEVAIHLGLQKTRPNIELIGCRIHLAQSLWKKIQEAGLSSEYRNKEKSDVAKWLGTFGLPFLNPAEVSDCFVEDFMLVIPNCNKIYKYADYIVESYISEETAQFPPTMWACRSATRERTTNACESFHSKFNRTFYMPHQYIFQFLEVLK